MAGINSVAKWVASGLVLCLLCACTPYQRWIEQGDLSNQVIAGTRYQHRVLINPAGRSHPAPEHWHVYIEGDGRAVDGNGRPSRDPTPRTPLLLPMVLEDPAPALYLGRPCYFHTADAHCSPVDWTLGRYSRDTVDSMAAVVRRQIPATATLTLIGHSGGGTLAVLLAAQLTNVTRVVTLAGNLQVAQWTRHHHYSPLTLSLDPGSEPPLEPGIQQFHFAGAQDEEVLPSWIQHYARQQPDAHFQLLQGTGHRQGWPLWWTLISFEPTIKTP